VVDVPAVEPVVMDVLVAPVVEPPVVEPPDVSIDRSAEGEYVDGIIEYSDLKDVSATRGVLGWSAEGHLLAVVESLELGHGFYNDRLVLYDASTDSELASVRCPLENGIDTPEDHLFAAEAYRPVLQEAQRLGVRSGLGVTTLIRVLEEDGQPVTMTQTPEVWDVHLMPHQPGTAAWTAVRMDLEYQLPTGSTAVTTSPDGAHNIWLMGDFLLPVPPVPTTEYP
jgi:hypothetical protein